MSPVHLALDALRRALSIRDLSDPEQGPHAMQRIVDDVVSTLASAWGCEARVVRGAPLVAIADNYDRLGYAEDAIARDARHSRYVSEATMLRSHTSAMIPGALRALAEEDAAHDVLIAVPGITYRRDSIDRLHTGEPHQLDLWRIRRGPPLVRRDLEGMIACAVRAALPGRGHVISDAVHPYTTGGLQVEVEERGGWVEIGECGLAHPDVLARAGLDPASWSGLAMGLGLDRLLMLRKGIPDIRLLRSDDPRIGSQMQDLSPYHAVSSMPPVRRDLSIAVEPGTTIEELGDRVRAALAERASMIESITEESRTAAAELPEIARARIGLELHQENVLLRVVLRAVDRTLTHEECNRLRDEIYVAVHCGSVAQWAARAS
ncbi:hypothetical protein [Sandaracinus amylolyticus]|uniref:PheS-related mystery ligase SrmL n=1 Tax=Sandaracinus amylolyticus TaxID=927083 RepID=UPI001F31FB4F|nr:hypothetical protein [Sandaracinus amylolyticus]UJR83413.1 Hypothetical protein I5071_54810 [Sandaracinus amylolyticus]